MVAPSPMSRSRRFSKVATNFSVSSGRHSVSAPQSTRWRPHKPRATRSLAQRQRPGGGKSLGVDSASQSVTICEVRVLVPSRLDSHVHRLICRNIRGNDRRDSPLPPSSKLKTGHCEFQRGLVCHLRYRDVFRSSGGNPVAICLCSKLDLQKLLI